MVIALISRPACDQRAMAALEREYLVDVPLGLTHLVVSGRAHQLLALTAAAPSAAPSAAPDGGQQQQQFIPRMVSTLALACRLLLQV